MSGRGFPTSSFFSPCHGSCPHEPNNALERIFMEKEQQQKQDRIIRNIAIGVIAIFLFYPIVLWLCLKSLEQQGQFGDMFGAVTALFSGLTIVGLIYTIILQREDIKIARQSLIDQKEELKLNRDEFKIQNETLGKQRFENTFFHLLCRDYKVSDYRW